MRRRVLIGESRLFLKVPHETWNIIIEPKFSACHQWIVHKCMRHNLDHLHRKIRVFMIPDNLVL